MFKNRELMPRFWCRKPQAGAGRAPRKYFRRWLLLTLSLGLLLFGMQLATFQYQAAKLAKQRHLSLQLSAASYQRDLGNLLQLTQAVFHGVAQLSADEVRQQLQALTLLEQLNFGRHSYLLVHDQHGQSLLNIPEPLPNLPGHASKASSAHFLETTWRPLADFWRYSERALPKSAEVSPIHFLWPFEKWGWSVALGVGADSIMATADRLQETSGNPVEPLRHYFWLQVVLSWSLLLGLGYSLYRYFCASLRWQIAERLQRRLTRAEGLRAHLARELHDGPLQMLVSSKYLLESAQLQPASGGGARMLERGLQQLGAALQDIRRVTRGMGLANLQQGLPPALEQLLGVARSMGWQTQFEQHGPVYRLSIAAQTALYRIAQEAISNAMQHSGGSRLALSLRVERGQVHLALADNGNGQAWQFLPGSAGMGLQNMRDRVEQLGGRFQLLQLQPGVAIAVSLPMEGSGSCG